MKLVNLKEIDFINFGGYTLTEEYDYEEKKHTAETFSLYNQGFEVGIYKKLEEEDYYEGVSVSCGVPYFQFYVDGNVVYIGPKDIKMQEILEGVKMKTHTDKSVEQLWLLLTDVPFDENEYGEMILAEDWAIFSKGDARGSIWHWFDKMHSKGVAWLLYEFVEDEVLGCFSAKNKLKK